MTPETVFPAANLVAVVGWILLLAAPRSRWTARTAGAIVPLLLAATYLVLIVAHWGEGRGGFSTLEEVAALFANRWLLLAGWVHYLAFDLLVGAWETRDAAARGISHWLVIPCLLATFLFGPIGFLAYCTLRQAAGARAGQGVSPV